ncbi:MAG: hypothetical protein AAGI53_01390 [Planctomycetota bacterium]
MERASEALGATRYFEAVSLADRALRRAHAERDFLTMARVCLPLQEARRQIRQTALDAAETEGIVQLRHADDLPRPLRPGCCLVIPPMIGADGRALNRAAVKRRVPLFVLTREPMTQKLTWPMVSLAERSFRAYVAPPVELEYRSDRMVRDAFDGPIPIDWFTSAAEALGDAAIASVGRDLHPWWRVDDLLVAVEAMPEHEKLHQRLADACRAAAEIGEPAEDRRLVDGPNPYSF